MRTRAMAAGLVAAGLMLAGCQQDAPLVTGSVDTTKILRFDSEYQDLAQQYFNERIKLAGELQKAVGSTGGEIRDQATYDRFVKLERELGDKWLKRTRDFTKTRLEKVQAAAEAVSKEKGLDLVVLDSDEFPTVEYGAVDITGDILDQMPGFAGGATQASPAIPQTTGAKPSGEATR